jgi:hypothetical protein
MERKAASELRLLPPENESSTDDAIRQYSFQMNRNMYQHNFIGEIFHDICLPSYKV